MSEAVQIHGTVAPGFERVRDALRTCFDHGEIGAAVCVMKDGERVVDLWAGVTDVDTEAPWQAETLSVAFSATKGIVALAFAMIIERGVVELDAPVASWWPEFGANGKHNITLRQCLNHRAGLHALDQRLTLRESADPGVVDDALVRQAPLWEPGSEQGYGATAWGMVMGALFRHVTGTSVGSFIDEEISKPLGLDLHLGLRASHDDRVATLYPAPIPKILRRFGLRMVRAKTTEGSLYRAVLFDRSSHARRAFFNPDLGPKSLGVMNETSYRRVELPWMGMYTNARSLAEVYGVLANGGERDGVRLLSEITIARLMHPQSWSNHDHVLHKPMGFSEGFQKEEPHLFSPDGGSFGHSGVGGTLGFADPHNRLSFGYVLNGLDPHIRSPRCTALCRATYKSLGLL
jgi:CubicO group peptidase (beta-lactamase class C family)